MRSTRGKGAGAAGTASAGEVIHVPAPSGEQPPASADELASLTLAERAARALEHDRGPREIPIDRAFLEGALDLRRILRTLVAAVIPRFADWCFVDLIDEAGVPHRVEVVPADRSQAPLAAQMLALGVGGGWATPAAQAIRDRAPRLYREFSPELMAWATHDERHLAVFRAMGPSSLVAVPLVARDRVIGAITIVRSTMVPALDERALGVAEEIAAPAALAIDVARRYEAERAARIAAEERAGRERPAGTRPEPAGTRPKKARPRQKPKKALPRRPSKGARKRRGR